MKVTQKEYGFLKQISTSDFANEGWWEDSDRAIGDWVGDWGYDMRVVRGLMSSLQEKKVIGLYREVYDEETWVYVKKDYLDYENEKLINLEVA
jgi:hypothetical protein